MSIPSALIAAWARSAVAPYGGAFCNLQAHAIAAPVLQGLLARAGVRPHDVDAVVLGNALGAGGNPARMLALAAGLPQHCAAYSVDTQCCSGLDAVTMAVGLLATGQASVVVAGGVEAWSRAPIRHTRPLHEGEPSIPYERPAFAPHPAQDPDLLQAAALYAQSAGITRIQQDTYALHSHARALSYQAQQTSRASAPLVQQEIIPINGLAHDPYPRSLSPERLARLPVAAHAPEQAQHHQQAHQQQHPQKTPTAPDCAVSLLAVSPRADAAALLLLATPEACQRLHLTARAQWLGALSIGCAPEMPLLAAQHAASALLAKHQCNSSRLQAIELHDAFAVQGISFCHALGLDPEHINRGGGGLARGHPIGASGAIALVRLLAELQSQRHHHPHAQGLAAVAAAGGLGAAALVGMV